MDYERSRSEKKYRQLEYTEMTTLGILELYSELLAESKNDLIEPISSQTSGGDLILQKRMLQMEEEEGQNGTDKVDKVKVISNTKLEKMIKLNDYLLALQANLHDVIGSITNLEAVKMPNMRPISHESH